MAEPLSCWKCGASLRELPLPLSRLAECPKCRAYLHVCRLCEFHDPSLTGRCREERAEAVRDPETANFCDWFKPRARARGPEAGGQAEAAKSQLEGLFGRDRTPADNEPGSTSARAELDRLFGSRDKNS
jgi:hypothetical protein